MALLGEYSLTDWSVGIWRRTTDRRTRRRDAAEDTVRLIGESGSVEQRGEGFIGVTVSKY
jgi:hypothetical protein